MCLQPNFSVREKEMPLADIWVTMGLLDSRVSGLKLLLLWVLGGRVGGGRDYKGIQENCAQRVMETICSLS